MDKSEIAMRQGTLFDVAAVDEHEHARAEREALAKRGGYWDWLDRCWRPVVKHRTGMAFIDRYGHAVPFPWE